MQRLHIHLSVPELGASIRFYQALFNTEPTLVKEDYAKWQLDDPRVNFAISTRSGKEGLDHLGIQAETETEMQVLRDRLNKAQDEMGMEVMDQGETTCCYAESDKTWTVDTVGTAWEVFHSMGDAAVFGDRGNDAEGACCVAAPVSISVSSLLKK